MAYQDSVLEWQKKVQNAVGGNLTVEGIGLAINMGQLPGWIARDKFGINPEVSPSTDPESIIEQGGRVIYDAVGTAPIQYLSSSSAADTGQEIEIEGLDINGDRVVQTAITNGQSNVVLSTPLWRQDRMGNNSPDIGGLDIQGTLYCHTDPSPTNGVPADENIRTIITSDSRKNQTLYAASTVPRGYVGFLFRGEIGLELDGNAASLSEYARCHYESRRFGKRFRLKKSVTVFPGSPYQDYRPFPDVVPGLTDIELVADIVTQTMGLWATFDLILVPQDEFPPEYLQAIGQPGA